MLANRKHVVVRVGDDWHLITQPRRDRVSLIEITKRAVEGLTGKLDAFAAVAKSDSPRCDARPFHRAFKRNRAEIRR